MNSLAPEMDRRVWPPILVGKRKACFTVPYVHDDSDANVKVTLAARFMTFLQSAISLTAITVESLKCDQCPVYVFPPSVEAFTRASYMDGHCETFWVRAAFPKLMAGWTLKYAVVEDMARIDPYRRLVNWFAIDEHKGISKDVPIRMIGTPQCLSAIQKEEFQAQLRKLDDAKSVEEIDVMERDDFKLELSSTLLFQGRLKGNILSFLKMMTFRNSHMEKAFALDEVRVSNASFERLNSLGVLMGGEREHAAKAVTSRLIDRGTQRELESIQRMTDEIQRATATKRRLRELKVDLLTSSRLLVEKQNNELMQHLDGWATKSQTLMEEAMLSRIKFNTFLRQTEKKAYILQQLISSGATEIVEEVNRDALKETRAGAD